MEKRAVCVGRGGGSCARVVSICEGVYVWSILKS